MSTDIHGGIEVLDPHDDEDFGDEGPWVLALDLSLLCFDSDYTAFGCLFGVRNIAGWDPVVPARGLPDDVSAGVLRQFAMFPDEWHSPTWATWGELRDIDMDAVPVGVGSRGLVTAVDFPGAGLRRLYWVSDAWPASLVERFGVPPVGDGPAVAEYGEWRVGEARLRYERFTRRQAIGAGSDWEHVFRVMEALAGRFGADGVRMVVYFD